MKTIGVLGGLGPQATMDFEQRVHRVSQKLLPQKYMMGYPPMLVYFYRFAPVILGDDGPKLPMTPDPRLFEAASSFKGRADCLVVPSNIPHLFQKELEQAAGCPMLSIIDTTLAEVERRGLKKVGVVGYGNPAVYTEPMKARGLVVENASLLDPELQHKIDHAVHGVMEGATIPDGPAMMRAVIALLRSKQVEGIVLGCTELPLLLGEYADEDILNPSQLLAERAVRFAIA